MLLLICSFSILMASSHREAPLIADDPLADNVDVYAFKNPRNQNSIVLVATYVPLQLPHGGPNYYSFGENIRYEIHVDNDALFLVTKLLIALPSSRKMKILLLSSHSFREAKSQNYLYPRKEY